MKEMLTIEGVEYVRKDSVYEKRREGPWEIGERYYIETVTKYFHGILLEVTEHELVFQEMSWIPDTGRFWNFITRKSPPNEVEPFDKSPVLVGRTALILATKQEESYRVQK